MMSPLGLYFDVHEFAVSPSYAMHCCTSLGPFPLNILNSFYVPVQKQAGSDAAEGEGGAGAAAAAAAAPAKASEVASEVKNATNL